MSASELVAQERGLRPVDNLMATGFTRDMNGTDSDAPGSRKSVRFMRSAMRFKAAPGSEQEYVTVEAQEMTIPLWRANEMAQQGMGYIMEDAPADHKELHPMEKPTFDPGWDRESEPKKELEKRVDGLESKMDRILALLEAK